MQYLFLYEDGTIGQTDNTPTEEDMGSVAEGYLTILYFDAEKNKYIDYQTKQQIDDLELSDTGDFHFL